MKRIAVQSDQISYSSFDNYNKCNSFGRNNAKVSFGGKRLWIALGFIGLLMILLLANWNAFPSAKLHIKKVVDDRWLIPVGINPINPHDYPYLLNEETLCGSATISLMIFVASSPDHRERREAIRETWGNKKNLLRMRSRLMFLLGKPKDGGLQEQLIEESYRHADILQEDFVDAYGNLTLKSVMALKWTALYCPRTQFIMKTDDDIFVNLPRLVEFLQMEGNSKWIVGCIKQRKSPRPISLSGLPAPPGHPPFAAGAGYIISSDLVLSLYRASLQTHFIPIEDVFISAHCARAIGVAPAHHDDFSCGEAIAYDCQMTHKFTGHHVTPEKQRHLWQLLNDPQQPCANEKIVD